MAPAIDPNTNQPQESQGSSGAPAVNADLGSFVSSIGAVSGALSELLSVVTRNSSEISADEATLGKAQMAVYLAEQAAAANNLETSLNEETHKGWFKHPFKSLGQAVVKGIDTAVVKIGQGNDIAFKAINNHLIPHQLLNAILPAPLANALSNSPGFLKKMQDHVEHGLYAAQQGVTTGIVWYDKNVVHNVVSDHLKKYMGVGVEHVVKAIAYPFYQLFYHELKLVDPHMSDEMAKRIAHIAADITAVVIIIAVVTVATGGAAIGEEIAEVGEAVGEVAEDGFGMEIESLFADDAAAAEGAGEGASAGEGAEGVEGAGEVEETGEPTEAPEAEAPAAESPVEANNRIDSQRLQHDISRMTRARQKLRAFQAIMGVIKGIEQLGSSYFDARMAFTSKQMGHIQASMKATQSTLEEISKINQMNADTLKETTEDVLADITQLYNGLSAVFGSMSQAMYR